MPSSFLQMAAETQTNSKPESFDRAVECAEHYGLCNVDELLNLAGGKFE